MFSGEIIVIKRVGINREEREFCNCPADSKEKS